MCSNLMRIPPKARLEFTYIEIVTYFKEVSDRVDVNALNQTENSQDALAAKAVIWDSIMRVKRFVCERNTCKLATNKETSHSPVECA